jgi:hypothetical protein
MRPGSQGHNRRYPAADVPHAWGAERTTTTVLGYLERAAINASLSKLQLQLSQSARDAANFEVGVIRSLFCLETDIALYDKKYFIRDGECYKPLFPLVEEVYMFTWKPSGAPS